MHLLDGGCIKLETQFTVGKRERRRDGERERKCVGVCACVCVCVREREREREREKEEVGGQFSWQQEQPKPHVLTHRFDVGDM